MKQANPEQYQLIPEWLYCNETDESNHSSPCARLSFIDAIEGGDACQPLIKPSQTISPKTIVISYDSIQYFQQHENYDLEDLVLFLQNEGFPIIQWTQDAEHTKLIPTDESIDYDNLANFTHPDDYKYLIRHFNLPRDAVAVFDHTCLNQLTQHFKANEVCDAQNPEMIISGPCLYQRGRDLQADITQIPSYTITPDLLEECKNNPHKIEQLDSRLLHADERLANLVMSNKSDIKPTTRTQLDIYQAYPKLLQQLADQTTLSNDESFERLFSLAYLQESFAKELFNSPDIWNRFHVNYQLLIAKQHPSIAERIWDNLDKEKLKNNDMYRTTLILGLAKYYDWFAERLFRHFSQWPIKECPKKWLFEMHESAAHAMLEQMPEQDDPESIFFLRDIIKAAKKHPSLYSKLQQMPTLIQQVYEYKKNKNLKTNLEENLTELKAAYGVVTAQDLRYLDVSFLLTLAVEYESAANIVVDYPEFYQYFSVEVLYSVVLRYPQIAQRVLDGESLYPGFTDQLTQEQYNNLAKLSFSKNYQSQTDSQQPMHIEHHQTFVNLKKQTATTLITESVHDLDLLSRLNQLQINKNIRKVIIPAPKPINSNGYQILKNDVNKLKQILGDQVTFNIGPVITRDLHDAISLHQRQTQQFQSSPSTPNSSFLYECSSTASPNNINDPASNNPSNALNFKPLFEIDQPVKQQTLQVLKSMKRMALREVYQVDGEGQLQPYQSHDLQTISPSHTPNTTDQHDITLRVINHASLQSVAHKPHCYFIPVLSPQQKLVTCSGGQIQQDELGRWLLFTNKAEQCQLTLSVPTQAPKQQIIDAHNFNSSNWDNLPYAEQLQQFFNGTGEGTLTYCNENNISCTQRVSQLFRLIIQQNPTATEQNSIFYAENDLHAFICIHTDTQLLKVDLGGARPNQSYQYEQLPSEHNHQATAQAPDELPELPSEYTAQNATSTEQDAESNSTSESTPNSTSDAQSSEQSTANSHALSKPLTNALIHTSFSEHERTVRRWVHSLKQRCVTKNKTQRLDSEQQLTSLLSASGKRLLFLNSNIHQLALKLLAQQQTATRCFYLQQPQQLDLTQTKAQLTENGDVTVNHQGFLGQFLEGARQSQEPHILLIDWSQFTANQRTAINTLLDDSDRQLLGHKIPSNVTIVGLAHTLPEDRSFVSRHDSIYEVDPALTARNSNSTTRSQTITIDMAGLSRWQDGLLGQVKVIDNKPHWHKSELVNYLEAIAAGTMNADVQFKIINYPDDAQDDIQATLEQAQARGYLIYQGLAIEFPQQADFVLGEHNLDLSEFVNNELVRCQTDIQRHQLPENAHIINSQWFELLLHDQIIDNSGQYSERPGLIEQAADANTPLALYITTPLDQTQWYNLC